MHEVAQTAAEWRTRHAQTPQQASKSEGPRHIRTDRHTHELKGSELYPLSERMRIYIAGLAGLAGLAWQGGVEDGGGREEVWRRGEGGYSVIY